MGTHAEDMITQGNLTINLNEIYQCQVPLPNASIPIQPRVDTRPAMHIRSWENGNFNCPCRCSDCGYIYEIPVGGGQTPAILDDQRIWAEIGEHREMNCSFDSPLYPFLNAVTPSVPQLDLGDLSTFSPSVCRDSSYLLC